FLRRVWSFCHNKLDTLRAGIQNSDSNWDDIDEASKTLRREVHTLLRQADYDYQRMQYNTVVSACMKMLNTLEAAKLPDTPVAQRALADATGILLRVLYPAVPHITWNLWNELGFAAKLGDLLDAPWPEVDEAALIADEIDLVLQVNGKLRGNL